MRNKFTKDRKRDREEFVYRHYEFLTVNQNLWRDEIAKRFVEDVVRKEIPFSVKTYWLDIWVSIIKCFKEVFNIKQ